MKKDERKEKRLFPDSLTGHHRIKFSETGHDGKLKIPSLLNLVQDSTMEHSRNNKISIFDLNKKNLTWVMIHFSLHINRRPKYDEMITTETFQAPVKGLLLIWSEKCIITQVRFFLLRSNMDILLFRECSMVES